MAKTRKSWFGMIRSKFLRSSPRPSETIIVLHTNNTTFSQEPPPPVPPPPPPSTPATITNDHICEGLSSKEAVAATKIQACFRRHLARRAYKALRGLVKLQAVVRGAHIRRQSRIALECMQALARLQVVVRARQLQLLTSNINYI